jgi:hypothetical protein
MEAHVRLELDGSVTLVEPIRDGVDIVAAAPRVSCDRSGAHTRSAAALSAAERVRRALADPVEVVGIEVSTLGEFDRRLDSPRSRRPDRHRWPYRYVIPRAADARGSHRTP